MKLSDLAGKNIVILGYGREGHAVLHALQSHAPGCEITIADQKTDIGETPEHVWRQLGEGWLENLHKFDVIIKSPGIPPNPALTAVAIKLTTGTNLFFDSIADTGALIVGVTGSKGKSTTSTLVHQMLLAGGKDAYLVGNIGKPALEFLDKAKPGAIFVHELSSYQLMDMHVSPHIAMVTSFFPEHLDYHGSLQAYMDAKKHVTKFQGPEDIVFFNGTSSGAAEIAKEGEGRKVPFTPDDAPVALEETKLLGLHNLSNLAGASLCARHLGVSDKAIIQAAKDFIPLKHRLEPVGNHHGIEWVDDAISTTPESAIAALDALGERVATMILGGQDRGYDFVPLAKRLAKSHVHAVILFPGSGNRIEQALSVLMPNLTIAHANSMPEAIAHAKQLTAKGSICLLSTASPSYGMFKNFEDKGDQFQACIKGS